MPITPKKVFASKELQNLLDSKQIKQSHKKWIQVIKENLLENMFAGEKIRKNNIPKEYARKYGLTNLYRYSHPEEFRSVYTIEFFN